MHSSARCDIQSPELWKLEQSGLDSLWEVPAFPFPSGRLTQDLPAVGEAPERGVTSSARPPESRSSRAGTGHEGLRTTRFSKGSKHGKGIPETNPWSLGLRISRIWFESHKGLLGFPRTEPTLKDGDRREPSHEPTGHMAVERDAFSDIFSHSALSTLWCPEANPPVSP